MLWAERTIRVRLARSVKPEFAAPIRLLCKLWLIFLVEDAGFQHQIIHLGPHEAAIAVFRRADSWLAAHIKAGIHDYRAAGTLAKGLDDFPVERVGFAAHALNYRRVVDIPDGAQFQAIDG